MKGLPIRYEKGFVDQVLLPGLIGQTSSGEQIEPPHLQIVCNQLYDEARTRYAADLADGELVQIGDDLYQDIGGTQGILHNYLDGFVERIANNNPEQTAIVRSMLKLMIQSSGTRKFVSLHDLTSGIPDVSSGDLERFTKQLQEGRVIEARGQKASANYSLSHEFMVQKVQSWYDEREMQRKKAEETLERSLAEWESNNSLLNETQVSLIRQWIVKDTLSKEAEQLLTVSQQTYERTTREKEEQKRRIQKAEQESQENLRKYAEEQRQRAEEQTQAAKKLRNRFIFAIVLAILAVSAAIGAVYGFRQAKKSEETAQQERDNAKQEEGKAITSRKQAEQAAKDAKRQLALNYLNNGVVERDKNNDTLKAAHYFMKAAESAALAEDPAFSKNVQLAGDILVRGAFLEAILEHEGTVRGAVFSLDESRILTWSDDGTARVWDSGSGQALTPPLAHQDDVNGAVFSQDERRILTWSDDGTARVWDLRADDDFPREYLILQVEIQTGTRLNDVGDFEVLSPKEWWKKKRQYEEISQEHLKTGTYPRANRFLNSLMTRPGSCDRPGAWLQEVNPAVVSEAASKYAGICLNRGELYLDQKAYDQAVRTFETVLQLRMDYPSPEQERHLAEADERLARTLIESGQDVEKGIEYARKSLKLKSDYYTRIFATDTLALGYIKQGRHAEAMELLKQALEKAPDEKSRQILQERLQQAEEGLKDTGAME